MLWDFTVKVAEIYTVDILILSIFALPLEVLDGPKCLRCIDPFILTI